MIVGLIGVVYLGAGSLGASADVSVSKYSPSQAKQEKPGECVSGFDSDGDVELLMVWGAIREPQRNSAIVSCFLKLEICGRHCVKSQRILGDV